MSSKLDLVKKCQKDGYNAADALMLADYEIVHGEDNATNFASQNIAKSSPSTTPTMDINSNWRVLDRLESNRKSSESGSTSINGIAIIDGKIDGKIPLAEYEKYRVNSVHNPDSDIMTLGKYEPTIREDGTKDFSVPGPSAYTVKAGDTTYFSLGTEWDNIIDTYGLDTAGKNMFDYFNKPVLDDTVSAGKK